LQLIGRRLLVVGRLQREEQQPVARERAVDRFDRQLTGERDRLQRQRKHDRVSKRERREFGGVVERLVGRHTCSQDTVDHGGCGGNGLTTERRGNGERTEKTTW